MRMLLRVTIPHETFNAAVRDGSVGRKLNRPDDLAKAGLEALGKKWAS